MERNRYATYDRRKQPRLKRRIRVEGSFEDRGKWSRCWRCGFILNADRDFSGSEDGGSYSTVAIIPASSPVGGGDEKSAILSADIFPSIGSVTNQNRFDVDGDFIPYYEPQLTQVSQGCPFCGTTNL